MKRYIAPACEMEMFATDVIMESYGSGIAGKPSTDSGNDTDIVAPNFVSNGLNIFR